MTCTSWTDARVRTLVALWKDGLSASRIATELGGVTRNAVLGKLHRLGLLGRRSAAARPRPEPRPRRRARRVGAAAAVRQEVPAHCEPSIDLPGLVGQLEALRARQCRWPIGDPRSGGFGFCGRPAEAGPYCAAHRRQAYRPRPARPGRGGGVAAR
jgi:GcrA cell cycle regulator